MTLVLITPIVVPGVDPCLGDAFDGRGDTPRVSLVKPISARTLLRHLVRSGMASWLRTWGIPHFRGSPLELPLELPLGDRLVS